MPQPMPQVAPIIQVGPSLTTIANVASWQLQDLFQNAPEPPPPTYGGLRNSSANLLYLQDRLPGAIWHDPRNRLLEARAQRYIATLRRTEPGAYEQAWPYKEQPFEFQSKVFAPARLMTNIAMAPAALGTGKTKMALDIAADKFMRDEIDGVLIIGPNGVHRQWIKTAIPRHLTDKVARALHIWSPTRKVKANMLANGRTQEGRRIMRFMAFNVESFSSESGRAYKAALEFCRSGRMMIIVDESSRIKTPGATRTKTIFKLRNFAICRMILTGTPCTQGVEDFFAQYQFLDPDIIGISNYTAFRNRYCVTVPAYRGAAFGVVKIVGYRNQEELVRRIAPCSFMIPKDVLGLPPVSFDQIDVPLTDEQRKLYVAMRDELVSDLRAQRVATPANAAVRILRLQQVLCGRYFERLIDEDEVETVAAKPIPSLRPDTLRQILEDHDGQAVIWARFKTDIDDIATVLRGAGYSVVTYDGRVKDKDRELAVEQFKSGEADYFVGNQAAGGTGVDGLQVASLAIYYSNSFNAEHRWQSEGRIHRIGTTEPVLYLDMVARGTVDSLILANLKRKDNVASAMREIMQRPDILFGDLEET